MTVSNSAKKGAIIGALSGGAIGSSIAMQTFFAVEGLPEESKGIPGGEIAIFIVMMVKASAVVLPFFTLAVGAALGGAMGALADHLQENNDNLPRAIR